MTGAAARPGELLYEQAQFYRGEGHKAQAVGDLDTAEASYRKAIINDPYYAEAYVDLGVILESRGKLLDAEASYQSALKVNPKLPAAHTNLGLLYERQGKIKEAGEHWQHRVRLGPEDDPWVARTKEKLKKYNLSIPESPAVMKKKREAEIKRAYSAGRENLKGKDFNGAVAEFRRVLELDPTHKGAMKGLEEATKWASLETEWRKALAADPNNKKAAKEIEALDRARGKLSERKAEAEKANPNKKAMLAAMDAAMLGQGATGQADDAWRWADEASKKAAEARKRMEAARKSADEAMKLALARQADMEKLKAEETKRSSSKAEEDAKRQQAIKEVTAARAQAQEAALQAEKAKAAAESAKKTAKGDAIKQADEAAKKALEVKQATDLTLKEADEISKALGIAVAARPAAAQKAAAPEPVIREATTKPVSASRAANDFEKDKTKTQLQAIRELYQRGVSAMRQGNYQEAVTNFEQVLALDPNHPEAKQGLKRAQIALSKSN